jgi:hypothetical protein
MALDWRQEPITYLSNYFITSIELELWNRSQFYKGRRPSRMCRLRKSVTQHRKLGT